MAAGPAQVSLADFDRLYGLELVEVGEHRVVGKVGVRDELRRALGPVHGGIFAALAESLASLATGRAVAGTGRSAEPLSNQISLLRPITEGTIHGVAVARHRGRTTWVWEVEITDDEGRLCAAARVTITIRQLAGE